MLEAIHPQHFVRSMLPPLLAGALISMGSVACSQRLTQPPPASASEFRLRETTKTQVLEALGLPTIREVEGNFERWGYADAAVVSAIHLPHASGGLVTTDTISLLRAQKIVLIYVFDSRGVLVDAKDLRETE